MTGLPWLGWVTDGCLLNTGLLWLGRMIGWFRDAWRLRTGLLWTGLLWTACPKGCQLRIGLLWVPWVTGYCLDSIGLLCVSWDTIVCLPCRGLPAIPGRWPLAGVGCRPRTGPSWLGSLCWRPGADVTLGRTAWYLMPGLPASGWAVVALFCMASGREGLISGVM